MTYRCYSRDLLRNFLSKLAPPSLLLLPELCCHEVVTSCTLDGLTQIYYSLDSNLLPDLDSISHILDSTDAKSVVVLISVFNSEPISAIKYLNSRYPFVQIVYDAAISLGSYFYAPRNVDLVFTSPYKYFGSIPFSASSLLTSNLPGTLVLREILLIYLMYFAKLFLSITRRPSLLFSPHYLLTSLSYRAFRQSSTRSFAELIDRRLSLLFTVEHFLRLSFIFSVTRSLKVTNISLLSSDHYSASLSCFLFFLTSSPLPSSVLDFHGLKLIPWPSVTRNHISGGRFVYACPLCP